MKKKITALSFGTIILFSCSNPELEKSEAKSKDISCKIEAMKEIMEQNNILALCVDLGIGKEYNQAFSKFNDTTLTCLQANNQWEKFMDKYDSLSKLKFK